MSEHDVRTGYDDRRSGQEMMTGGQNSMSGQERITGGQNRKLGDGRQEARTGDQDRGDDRKAGQEDR